MLTFRHPRGRAEPDRSCRVLPKQRSREIQRAFRARRAQYIAGLEHRVAELEAENAELRRRVSFLPTSSDRDDELSNGSFVIHSRVGGAGGGGGGSGGGGEYHNSHHDLDGEGGGGWKGLSSWTGGEDEDDSKPLVQCGPSGSGSGSGKDVGIGIGLGKGTMSSRSLRDGGGSYLSPDGSQPGGDTSSSLPFSSMSSQDYHFLPISERRPRSSGSSGKDVSIFSPHLGQSPNPNGIEDSPPRQHHGQHQQLPPPPPPQQQHQHHPSHNHHQSYHPLHWQMHFAVPQQPPSTLLGLGQINLF